VNLSLDMWQILFPTLLGQVHRSFSPGLPLYWVLSISGKVSSQTSSCSFVLFNSYSLWLRFWKVSNVLWVCRMSSYFSSRCSSFGRTMKRREIYCCYWKMQPP